MRKRVAITGTGLISSLGHSPLSLHATLCAESKSAGSRSGPFRGPISSFEPEAYLNGRPLRSLDRTGRLVSAAAKLALADAAWSANELRRRDVGLVLGTMFGSIHTISEFDRRALARGPAYASPMDFANTVLNAAAGQTAILHNLRGTNSTVAAGATSGLMALGYATDLIRLGCQHAVLAGGAEEFCFESFCGFERAGMCAMSDHEGECAVPFDARRTGFALAEAAALLVLEEWDSACDRGTTILAEIVGHGNAYDPNQGDGEPASIAVFRAMRAALCEASLSQFEMDCISASANGSRTGDQNEAIAISALFNAVRADVPVTAIKSWTGETLGAGGALQTVAMIETLKQNQVPGIRGLAEPDPALPELNLCRETRSLRVRHALINSVGLDGNACALIIAEPDGLR